MKVFDKIVGAVYRRDYALLAEALSAHGLVTASDEDGRTLLIHAVLAQDADAKMIEFLIAYGADVNAYDKNQHWTPLHFAARSQRADIIQILLDNGATVDAEDVFGNTPLWRCVMHASPNRDAVLALVRRGANASHKNKHGNSPRDVAISTAKRELVQLFEGG